MTNNEKIGAGIVAGVILYLLFKKPKFYVVDKQSSSSGGGGGGIMPIIMPLSTSTPPTPTTTSTPPKPTDTAKPSFPTCPSGELWNPKLNKCEVIKLDKPSDVVLKPPTDVVNPYDPCQKNGYGGTYDPASNSCLKSPLCGGGTLKLDSNWKMLNCGIETPTGGGGVVVGGVVSFSGKVPLTLGNLLM